MKTKLLLLGLLMVPAFGFACESDADCPSGQYCMHSELGGNYCRPKWPRELGNQQLRNQFMLHSVEGTTISLSYQVEESAGWTISSQIELEIRNPSYQGTEAVVLELDNYRSTEASPNAYERQLINSWKTGHGSFQGRAQGIVLISDRPGEVIRGQSIEITVSGKKLTNPETGGTKFNLQLLKQ